MQSKATLFLKWVLNYRRFSTTTGFMQVGLDLVTSANCKSELQFGQTNIY